MKSKTSFFERLASAKAGGNSAKGGGGPAFAIPRGAPLKGLSVRGLFNRTLFFKNLTRNWPLWGMASFFIALFPLAMLSEYLRDGGNILGRGGEINPLDFTYLYYIAASIAPPALLVYSAFCAMLVWEYLCKPRSVGLMHALPIRREGLFVTNFLSGLAMVAIPCAAGGGLCVLASLVMGAFDAKGLFVTVLAVAGEGFFYFSTATAAAFITGNIFAMPMLYFIFHFLAPLCDLLISTISSFLVFGLEGQEYTGVVEFLSPTIYLMRHVQANTVYEETSKISEYGGATHYYNTLASVSLENAHLIAIYALVGVGLLAIALVLYRLRRSECAGDVIAVNWVKPVFRYSVSAVMAVGGGQLLYLAFWNGFDEPGRYALMPLIMCMILAGLIGYYIASMLLAKTLRVFHGTWPGAAAVALGCVVLCSVLYFDGFGIAARIPADSAIESVYINTAGNSYTLFPDTDAELITRLKEVQRAMIADQEHIIDFRYMQNEFNHTPEEEMSAETVTGTNIRIIYYLKNGMEVARRYFFPLTRERLDTPGTYDYLLDQFINGEGMKNKRLHAGDARYHLQSGRFYLYEYGGRRGGGEVQFSSRELEQIIAALEADTAAGAWDYDWFGDRDANRYAMNMHFEFVSKEEDGGNRYDYITVYPKSGMDHTIAALKEMGYVTDSDLITLEEFYEKQTEWDSVREEFYDGYGYYPEEAPEMEIALPAIETNPETEVLIPAEIDPEPASADASISSMEGSSLG